ncbi:hypothetical protein D3C79_599280 [compost metagenome]
MLHSIGNSIRSTASLTSVSTVTKSTGLPADAMRPIAPNTNLVDVVLKCSALSFDSALAMVVV